LIRLLEIAFPESDRRGIDAETAARLERVMDEQVKKRGKINKPTGLLVDKSSSTDERGSSRREGGAYTRKITSSPHLRLSPSCSLQS
jgi:hypothetical protein